MTGKSKNSIGYRGTIIHSGTKLRNEKKNNFEDFTVLFAGSKVYISDKAYPLGETFIESHLVSFQEDESRLNYYCIGLFSEFASYIAERFSHKKRNALSRTVDIVTLRDLYRKISAIIGGEEQMERLNLLIRQRFLIVSPMAAFLQGLTTDLLLNLTYRDLESDKQLFQLVPDGGTLEGAL